MALIHVIAKLGWASPRGRRRTLAIIALWAVTAVLALALPLAAPPEPPATEVPQPTVAATAPQEGLGAFMRSKRWGGASLREIARRQQQPAQKPSRGALNPELREMGFVGLFVVPGTTSILLTLENGLVQRFNIGDQLPDGRMLAAVDENRLTLTGADQQRHELLLFPEVAAG